MIRQRQPNSGVIDLSDVPPQPPIPKAPGRVKEGASKQSKYIRVSFRKHANKWVSIIKIDGKQRYIGYYDDEERASVDYTRAVVKYKAVGTKGKSKSVGGSRAHQQSNLSDVPPQPPIPKHHGHNIKLGLGWFQRTQESVSIRQGEMGCKNYDRR